MTAKRICIATTARGVACRAVAEAGSDRCHVHNGRVGGRPTALNDERVMAILRVLRAGGHMDTAAQAAGIAVRTLHGWLQRGTSDDVRDAPFRQFREAVEQTMAESETRNVAIIATAAQSNWQAAAWLLERTYPERWARPSQRAAFETGEPAAAPEDPFAEVDELATRRRRHA